MANEANGKASSAPARRTSPAQFVREVRQETAKVTWPTRKETTITTIMVFIMVVLAMVFFFAVDSLIGFTIRGLFGLF